jgi:anti-sigma regulatory factor (Ser/Thr protein kinase)
MRALGAEVGLDRDTVELMALAVSELGHNQLDHARDGELFLRTIQRDGVQGLEVVAMDRGGGLTDPYGALQGRIAGLGLGVGLASVRRIADELDLDVRLEEGTTVVLRRFAKPLPRRPEVAILARPHPDEPVAGDDAALVQYRDGFLLAVADGVGHGPDARDAAARVVDVVRARAETPLRDLLSHVHDALHHTRGAAVTVARYDSTTERFQVAGIGNVMARLVARGQPARHFAPSAGTLGMRKPRLPIRLADWPLTRGAVLLVATDGVRARMDLASEPQVLLRSAVGIAQHVLENHARPHDDALVAVVR